MIPFPASLPPALPATPKLFSSWMWHFLPHSGCLEEETTSSPTGLKAQTPQGPSSEHSMPVWDKRKTHRPQESTLGGKALLWILELNILEWTTEEQTRVCVILILLTSGRKVKLRLSLVISSIALHQGVKSGRKTFPEYKICPFPAIPVFWGLGQSLLLDCSSSQCPTQLHLTLSLQKQWFLILCTANS